MWVAIIERRDVSEACVALPKCVDSLRTKGMLFPAQTTTRVQDQ